MTLRADDRVLLLDIPSTQELAAMARVLMQGVLVGIGSQDEVNRARSAMAEFENVMFIDASPQQIPWREHYFTKIVVPAHMEPVLRNAGAELNRVLAAGGEIVFNQTPV